MPARKVIFSFLHFIFVVFFFIIRVDFGSPLGAAEKNTHVPLGKFSDCFM